MANQEVEIVPLMQSPAKEAASENKTGKDIQQLLHRIKAKFGCEKDRKCFHLRWKLCLLVLVALQLLAMLPFWIRVAFFDFQQGFDLLFWSHFHHLPKGTQPKNFTFPSVEERVRYYMSNWYRIPQDYTTGLNISSSLCGDMKLCRPGSECQQMVVWILSEESIPDHIQAGSYESDALLLFESLETEQRKSQPRIAIVYGNKRLQNPEHPVFAKVRYTEDAQPLQPVTSQPIVSYLHSHRHYGFVPGAVNYFKWKDKRDTLVFRGADSGHGSRRPAIQKYNEFGKYSLQDIDIALIFPSSGQKPKNYSYDRTKSRPWFRDRKTQYQLLQYKYLLVMEGNDVSSGLKWMLFSNSVVFMAKPTTVSWAMEDLLEPFVHYVPVKDDFSDLLEMVQWAQAHDEECELISQQATQYMYDLHMSPQASKDREEILSRMMQRYYTNYSPILSNC